jgi:hypothetical protein
VNDKSMFKCCFKMDDIQSFPLCAVGAYLYSITFVNERIKPRFTSVPESRILISLGTHKDRQEWEKLFDHHTFKKTVVYNSGDSNLRKDDNLIIMINSAEEDWILALIRVESMSDTEKNVMYTLLKASLSQLPLRLAELQEQIGNPGVVLFTWVKKFATPTWTLEEAYDVICALMHDKGQAPYTLKRVSVTDSNFKISPHNYSNEKVRNTLQATVNYGAKLYNRFIRQNQLIIMPFCTDTFLQPGSKYGINENIEINNRQIYMRFDNGERYYPIMEQYKHEIVVLDFVVL